MSCFCEGCGHVLFSVVALAAAAIPRRSFVRMCIRAAYKQRRFALRGTAACSPGTCAHTGVAASLPRSLGLPA
eukprot:15453864-Alexandrium_andersonii.AAC.1